MAILGRDGIELKIPDDTDLPSHDGEVMPPRTFRVPDHTDLPDSDGEIVENTQELPQAILLTDSIRPALKHLHPDGQFFVGGNSGIYWDLTDPPLRGAIGPDWFYVPYVPPLFVEGKRRRSYVLWKEVIRPTIVLEFASGDGAKERDRTPNTGKFWVYERRVRADYYGIYEVDPGRIELYELDGLSYRPVAANDRGHYRVGRLGLELGIWPGRFHDIELPWLRWWDDRGRLLPTSEERADALAARLRSLGVDPDDVLGSA